ncbi:hypothetical protein HNR00_001216 [Methylorubrum rhodinum]|uniref:Uncharacterized protein n=1 Tax=Methylorubrum rhodinum TaxID=29428 RepID=A0A840ZH69_9HYPH|nr:hypothetical protein [Methylorubrum rhodinum]MBB5756518.1 hypothetical protein [Methylorubrum rhodinum]
MQENYSDTSQNLMMKTLLRDKATKFLLRKIIISNISTRHARTLSWHELSRLIEITRIKQKSYVPLYHVSVNFALYGGADWQCNWSRSESLLKWNNDEPEYTIIRLYFPDLQGLSTAYKHKGVGYHFAAYNWLDHFGGNYMRPEKPSASKFVDILLDKTDDLDTIRSYLGQYAFVRSQLQRQGYVVADLQLSAPLPIREVSFEPLPDELTNLI